MTKRMKLKTNIWILVNQINFNNFLIAEFIKKIKLILMKMILSIKQLT